MAFTLQPAIEGQTNHSDSFPIRRIIVCNGVAQVVRCSRVSVSAAGRSWIPQSLEIGTFSVLRIHQLLSSISFESESRLARIESHAFSSSSLQSIIVPRSVEILGLACFALCKSLSSITFETDSRLTRIEAHAFSVSSLQSIIIPRSVDILDSSCFSSCQSLSSITFESESRLTRIGAHAFSRSSLHSIIIPRSVQFIDRSAFADALITSISVEAGNTIFEVANELLIDIVSHKLIHNFSHSSSITIPRSLTILGLSCFSNCKLLSSITFESDSRLTRIVGFTFRLPMQQALKKYHNSDLQIAVLVLS
jgi:hypothetical protein